MITRTILKEQVITDFQEWHSSEWKIKSYDDIIDHLHEIIESHIPVYTSDLLEVALSNLRLASAEPNYNSENVSPSELISLNIYELLCDELQQWYDWISKN